MCNLHDNDNWRRDYKYFAAGAAYKWEKKEAGLRTRILSVPTGQTQTGETIITNRYYHNLPHTIKPQVQPAVWDISAEHSGP